MRGAKGVAYGCNWLISVIRVVPKGPLTSRYKPGFKKAPLKGASEAASRGAGKHHGDTKDTNENKATPISTEEAASQTQETPPSQLSRESRIRV